MTRDSELEMDACERGIAPCSPPCPVNRTRVLDNNTDRFMVLMNAARADRELRVRTRPSNAMSLSFAAQAYGIVPHAEADPESRCYGCKHAIRVNMVSASLLRYRMKYPDGVFGGTVDQEVRTAISI